MFTISNRYRQNISSLLIVSMIFSLWFVVAPNPAQASIWSTVKAVSRKVIVTGGALASGFMGGVLGAAVGGGPLGMALGAVSGYYLGNKVLGWVTNKSSHFATTLGAVAGGALCIGMGFPMIAAGVIGGGLIGLLVNKTFKKLFGNKPLPKVFTTTAPRPKVNTTEKASVISFMNRLNHESNSSSAAVAKTAQTPRSSAVSSPVNSDSQAAYNKYITAYKNYTIATQKGDSRNAKIQYSIYKLNLGIYNRLVKSGR